jgi:16S rRNA U1498 N3-methylase RsmE
MKSKLKAFIFAYSLALKKFETNIVEVDQRTLHHMQLNARFNTGRNIKVYGLSATNLEVKILNNSITNALCVIDEQTEEDVFNSIVQKIVDLGF